MPGQGAQKRAKKLKVKGTEYTIDELVDEDNEGGGKNGSCLWASEWLGVNASHPAAQAYYDSVVSLWASWGIGLLATACLAPAPGTCSMGPLPPAPRAGRYTSSAARRHQSGGTWT